MNNPLAIDGWMLQPELSWLAEQAHSHRRIVEIGSYKGRSTVALAQNTPGLVFAIDDFNGPREIELAGRESIYDQFLKNTAGMPNIFPVRCDHHDVPDPGFKPDMVFIDGGHEYENVVFDILYWRPRIVEGGLLCGHDFNFFEGVNRAVTELLPGYSVAPNTSIWYVTI